MCIVFIYYHKIDTQYVSLSKTSVYNIIEDFITSVYSKLEDFENVSQLSKFDQLLLGWESAELPRNRVSVNLFLRHIRDLSR